MTLRYYPALITRDDGATGFGVVFPDLPGCVSGGDTVQEAAEMAAEALALHVEGMMEEGLALPPASAPGEVPPWLVDVPGQIVTAVLVPVDVGTGNELARLSTIR
jgi:predicted RNase H-like HicB family nuclease